MTTDLASHAEALQHILQDLSTITIQQLAELFRQYGDLPNFGPLLQQAFPEMIAPHTQAAALISAQWYDELSPSSNFHAAPIVDLPPARIDKTVQWALHAPGDASPLDRLAGSSKRMVMDSSRTTVIGNAKTEGVSWARYASATACEFCRILATRGAVYGSKQSALKSHDHCRCIATPLRAGQDWTPPAYVAKWEDEYVAARATVSAAGQPQTLNNILAAMRAAK